MNANLNVLVVGCGRIAGGFDSGRVLGDWPRTHAGAYARHGGFHLVGCVDPDASACAEFQRGWGAASAFSSLGEAVRSGLKVDIVSICSPTSSHASDVRDSLALSPRAIVCEKPLATTAADASSLITHCAREGVLLLVNHTRRWDPDVADLSAKIEANSFGPLRFVQGSYCRGALNNGSHMIDLLRQILGDIRLVATGPPVFDGIDGDPSIPMTFVDRRGIHACIQCGSGTDASLFELACVFAGRIVAMEQGGLVWRDREVVASPHFSGVKIYGEGVVRRGRYVEAFSKLVSSLFDSLSRGSPVVCDGSCAVASQILCEEVRAHAGIR